VASGAKARERMSLSHVPTEFECKWGAEIIDSSDTQTGCRFPSKNRHSNPLAAECRLPPENDIRACPGSALFNCEESRMDGCELA
jgi:hypothetical protein